MLCLKRVFSSSEILLGASTIGAFATAQTKHAPLLVNSLGEHVAHYQHAGVRV